MTHAELQKQVCELLAMFSYEWLHVRKAIGYRKGEGRAVQTTTNISGWPDLAPVWSRYRRHRATIAIELKVGRDKVSADQAEVLDSLHVAGWDTLVVRPEHLQGLSEYLVGGLSYTAAPFRWPT